MKEPKARPKHFSMIREFRLADFFTLGNAASGMSAIFASMSFVQSHDRHDFLLAGPLLFAALAFDALDGRIARFRQTHSALGRELDSLADVISFGVAPAVMAFAAGMSTFLDRVVLVYFVVCGVSRLARYNVTAETLSAGADKVSHFEGTPIPSSVFLVAVLTFAGLRVDGVGSERLGDDLYWGLWGSGVLALHPFVLLFALSGSLMISKTLRIPKI
ncbi:MAG TPA: CDP-alcohol phosphatidyltransferase family protein [Polyangiaceae bacterium]|nr:CDP-alcohol phosphatidyltransferase family protein [Polyangiaceae bacterium]